MLPRPGIVPVSVAPWCASVGTSGSAANSIGMISVTRSRKMRINSVLSFLRVSDVSPETFSFQRADAIFGEEFGHGICEFPETDDPTAWV